MSIIKDILKEFKYSLFEIKNNISYAVEDAYYGYFRKDEYSKLELSFHLCRIKNSLLHPFIHIKNGIKNMWNWRTIIWKDRDFDQYYLYEILHKKLKNMEDFFYSKDTHIMDAEKYANQIKECRILVDRIINDAFHDEAFKEYYEKYPNKDFSFSPCESEKERVKQGLPARLYEMLNVKNEERDKMFRDANDLADRAAEEAKKKLFDNLAKNIDYWWD